ncbi:MAG: hypothetical protein HYU28_10490 [Actinobacteria bacterium]|nr:hypothetical protein [Actinomycetota bacterium]
MTDVSSVTVAVTHGSQPEVFIAENDDVISRVLALELVARTSPEGIATPAALDEIRSALLDERWADAVVAWMGATDNVVDVYGGERVWTEPALDAERASLEIRVSPIFRD